MRGDEAPDGYAALTSVGSIHVEVDRPNQDAWGADHAAGLYVVADGHGPCGDVVARAAVDVLLANEARGSAAAFAAASVAIDDLGEKSVASGATATVVRVRRVGEKVSVGVAHVGDTEVMVCDARGPRVVTRRHRTADPVEKARVVAAGAQVDREYVMDDLQLPSKMISVTRALGDVDMRPLGIVSQPEFIDVDITPADVEPPFLVIASDGLWDAHGGDLTPKVVADAVLHHGVLEGCHHLMDLAAGSDRRPSDDCTIVVVPLDNVPDKDDKRAEPTAEETVSVSPEADGADPADVDASTGAADADGGKAVTKPGVDAHLTTARELGAPAQDATLASKSCSGRGAAPSDAERAEAVGCPVCRGSGALSGRRAVSRKVPVALERPKSRKSYAYALRGLHTKHVGVQKKEADEFHVPTMTMDQFDLECENRKRGPRGRVVVPAVSSSSTQAMAAAGKAMPRDETVEDGSPGSPPPVFRVLSVTLESLGDDSEDEDAPASRNAGVVDDVVAAKVEAQRAADVSQRNLAESPLHAIGDWFRWQ